MLVSCIMYLTFAKIPEMSVKFSANLKKVNLWTVGNKI